MNFKNPFSHKKKRVGTSWRKPRGIHTKQNIAGRSKFVKIGWKQPEKPKIPVIETTNELEKHKEVIISSTIGAKKLLIILKKAQEKGIKVANYDINKKIEQINLKIAENKKKKQDKKAKLKEKTAITKKKEDKKELTEEEKKKELDKMLITGQ